MKERGTFDVCRSQYHISVKILPLTQSLTNIRTENTTYKSRHIPEILKD